MSTTESTMENDDALFRLLNWINENLDDVKRWSQYAVASMLTELNQKIDQSDGTPATLDTLAAELVQKLTDLDPKLCAGAARVIANTEVEVHGPSFGRPRQPRDQVRNDCTPYKNKIESILNVLQESDNHKQDESTTPEPESTDDPVNSSTH